MNNDHTRKCIRQWSEWNIHHTNTLEITLKGLKEYITLIKDICNDVNFIEPMNDLREQLHNAIISLPSVLSDKGLIELYENVMSLSI